MAVALPIPEVAPVIMATGLIETGFDKCRNYLDDLFTIFVSKLI
jgi:hypothetical protein